MTEIQGYTNLEIIGRGGFAIVYKATQVSVGRDVAIKLLVDPAPDDDLVRRFQRESKAVGALSWHPHIAAVVDAGATATGQAYIVFELLAGGSLEDRIAERPMPWPEAVAAMIEVADAVEAAHRAEVLHRDVKPANILLNRLGVAKLGDFGIASVQDGNKTETGMLATTVAHAAPELFNGEAASEATDVYALGSTLFTLVAGAAPFSPGPGERIGTTISRIAYEAPPATPSIPENISAVIAHALAKQPQYRPRSAGAFGQALQQAQQQLGLRVTTMPVTDAEPTSPPRPEPDPPTTPAPAPAVAQPLPASPATQHVPFEPVPPQTNIEPKKPFSRTILGLSVVAVALAVLLGGLIIFGGSAITTTRGGAQIQAVSAPPDTAMDGQFDAGNAVDLDDATYWGVQRTATDGPVQGTRYVVALEQEQDVVGVGISNGTSTELGRVSALRWATSDQQLDQRGDTVVTQVIGDAPGEHRIGYSVRTNRLVLEIVGVHADAVNVGIAEILIEVE